MSEDKNGTNEQVLLSNAPKFITIYEAFVRASKNFKTPALNKKVQYGKTNFAYADLAEVYNCVKDALLAEGLFIMHDFIHADGKQSISTYIQNNAGDRLGAIEFPLELNNKTMQEMGAQITYLKRYSMAALCSLAAEEDNDAVELKDIKLRQANALKTTKTIKFLMNQLPKERQIDFMGYLKREFGAQDFEDVPVNSITKIENMLEAELREQMEKKNG